jgi:hypothetical protein
MKNKQILEALASDLKRVTLGIQRNSTKMADRFGQEALKRKNETEILLLDPYMQKILINLEALIRSKNSIQKAEDILMYSTLIQNYSIYKLK